MNRKIYDSLKTGSRDVVLAMGVSFIAGNLTSAAFQISNALEGTLAQYETRRSEFERDVPAIVKYPIIYLSSSGIDLADYTIKKFKLKR